MPHRLRFLVRFGHKVQFYRDLEFAPSGFSDFERRAFDCAEGVGVSFVELELHFLEPVRDVFAVDAAHVDGPLVRVFGADVGGAVEGIEGFSDGAVNWLLLRQRQMGPQEGCGRLTEGPVDGDALAADGFSYLSWGHDGGWGMGYGGMSMEGGGGGYKVSP